MIQDMLTQVWVAEQAMDGLTTPITREEAMTPVVTLVVIMVAILDIFMTRTRMMLDMEEDMILLDIMIHLETIRKEMTMIGPIGAQMTMIRECILTNGTTKLITQGDFWMITSNWSC
jgi:hypothetical protein